MKYTVLTYNFNNYEILHEVENPDSEVEYLYITDDETLQSTSWKIIVDHDLDGMSPFDKCYAVRFNVWKYCTTDICIRLDGSILVVGNFDKFINQMNNENKDCAIIINGQWVSILQEYKSWVRDNRYSTVRANKMLQFISSCGINPDKENGEIVQNFVIQRNTKINHDIDNITYAFLKYLGDDKNIERLDQPITTFVLQKFFKNLKILFLSEEIVMNSYYCKWCEHNSMTIKKEYKELKPFLKESIWLGEKINLITE